MASKTKTSVQHGAAFAKGGNTRMAKPHAANPQKPGGTAHAVKGGAPGAKSAKGGGHAPVLGRVLSAKGGRTGVR
jgi:hypothetical protein